MMKSAEEKFLSSNPQKVGFLFKVPDPLKPNYATSFENFKTWNKEHSKNLFGHQIKT